jgi:hypothetical protein
MFSSEIGLTYKDPILTSVFTQTRVHFGFRPSCPELLSDINAIGIQINLKMFDSCIFLWSS